MSERREPKFPRSSQRTFSRPRKPPLRRQVTTSWDYPSQHYGQGMQGDARYVGATPSYVIWNVIQMATKAGQLVVDPMCGSGTTLDVARDTGRQARGFDVAPFRPDIEAADARQLPLADESVQLVFLDPPYGDHIDYSEQPNCIGKLSAYDEAYYDAMDQVFREVNRVLEPGCMFALYVCDYFEKKKGFAPVGFQLLSSLVPPFELVDIVSVIRHNKTLEMGNYRKAAEEGNFLLRGFNYLFLLRKPERTTKSGRRRKKR